MLLLVFTRCLCVCCLSRSFRGAFKHHTHGLKQSTFLAFSTAFTFSWICKWIGIQAFNFRKVFFKSVLILITPCQSSVFAFERLHLDVWLPKWESTSTYPRFQLQRGAAGREGRLGSLNKATKTGKMFHLISRFCKINALNTSKYYCKPK